MILIIKFNDSFWLLKNNLRYVNWSYIAITRTINLLKEMFFRVILFQNKIIVNYWMKEICRLDKYDSFIKTLNSWKLSDFLQNFYILLVNYLYDGYKHI